MESKPKRGITGRRRKLTPEMVADACRRIRLYRENAPKKVASDLGIGRETLRKYMRGEHKGEWR